MYRGEEAEWVCRLKGEWWGMRAGRLVRNIGLQGKLGSRREDRWGILKVLVVQRAIVVKRV